MKSKILSILFGTFAVILSACSTDIAPEPDAPSDKGESILRLEIQKQDLTRGVITSTSFEKGDSVLVYVWNSQISPNGYRKCASSVAIYNGKDWILKRKIDLLDETVLSGTWTSANVDVYYPCSAFDSYSHPDFSSEITIKDPLDQEDILFGSATGINADNPTAKITCDHIKTRLTFELKNNSDASISISKLSVNTEGEQLFLKSKERSTHSSEEYSRDYSMICNLEIPAGKTSNLDFLILPTEEAYEQMELKMLESGASKSILKFSLETSNKTINFDIDAKPWAAGQQYTYPVTLFYERKPIPDTDEYVDLGLSVLWAKCNLGADMPEGTGKFFFWGDTKGYEIGESYTQSTCSYVNNRTPEELLNENIVVEDPNALVSRYKYHLSPQYDAATQNLGQPWRMPTADEIYEFKENTKMEWYMEEGQWMFKFTSTVPGYENRYIIMPGQNGCFNGYYSEIKYIDSFNNTSNPAGVWWGSSMTDGTERAYGFNIAWGVGNPVKFDNPTNSLYSTFRSWGHPVRAVRPLRVQ